MIKLPLYNWFVNKVETTPISNTLKGSYGTDALKGMLSGTTFHYVVRVLDVGKDTVRLEASFYTISSFMEGSKRTEPTVKEFECSEHGILEAESWLNDNAKKVL
ncbi:MAG: hypothetical protein IKV58_01480 [Oscillospiraceae bacterium]|nr:hypothetical protein [Oscillospiraceae bacterium]